MSNSGLLAISAELKSVDKTADGAVVRVGLLDLFDGGYRLAGWHEAEGPGIAAQEGVEAREFGLIRQAVQGLGERLGRDLWDDDQDRPLVESADPVRRPPLGQVAALVSPRPRLRLWLAGLTPAGLDLAAQAASSGPTQILGQTRLTRHSHPTQITEIVARQRPQVLLIVGGHDLADPAAHEPVLALCNLIGRGLEAVPPSQRPTLLYAGSAPARARGRGLAGPSRWPGAHDGRRKSAPRAGDPALVGHGPGPAPSARLPVPAACPPCSG